MKAKLIAMTLLGLTTLSACDSAQKPTPEDFAAVEDSLTGNDNLLISALGDQGDYILKIQGTPELLEIAKKQKSTKFLSVTEPATYVEEGYCLLNIIPEIVMSSIDPENTCFFRLFCGTAEDIANNPETYAIELCR